MSASQAGLCSLQSRVFIMPYRRSQSEDECLPTARTSKVRGTGPISCNTEMSVITYKCFRQSYNQLGFCIFLLLVSYGHQTETQMCSAAGDRIITRQDRSHICKCSESTSLTGFRVPFFLRSTSTVSDRKVHNCIHCSSKLNPCWCLQFNSGHLYITLFTMLILPKPYLGSSFPMWWVKRWAARSAALCLAM